MPADVTTAFAKEEFPESRKRVPIIEGEEGRAKQELEGPRAGHMGCGVLLLTGTIASGNRYTLATSVLGSRAAAQVLAVNFCTFYVFNIF